MDCLLDTHTYLWMRRQPNLLPKRIAALLANNTIEILISPVVPWELAIKASTGKLNTGGLLINFEQRERSAGFPVLEITVAQVIASGMLPRHHRDPFDRLLAAQALDLGIALLSKDTIFDRYGVHRIWA